MEILERNGIQIPTTDHRVGSNKRRKSENLAESRSVKIKTEQTEAADSANKSLSWIHQCEYTGWGRISDIMLEPISETIYAVDTISQLPMAC